VYVVPTKPFSFEGTFFKPSHFPSELVLRDNGRLYQAIEVGGHAFGVEIFGSSPNSQKVGITITPKAISDSIEKAIKREVVTRYDWMVISAAS